MKGIQNFLMIINDNWTSIMVILGLVISILQKAGRYISKSDAEKLKIAKAQIQETMLKTISDAESDFAEWDKAGSIKRSQVISDIFNKYPILSKAVDQQEVINWIDNEIENSLKILQRVIDNKTS